jgi:hypothetical protein
LLEVSGAWRNSYNKVALDSVLTGQYLFSIRLKINHTFFARTFTAADRVQDYADLTSSFKKRSTGMNGDLFAVRLENYIEMFHLAYRALNLRLDDVTHLLIGS